MALTRETDLGTISVANLFFAQIIADSFKLDACKGKVWPATKKGRQIGSPAKFNLSEFANAIEVEESEHAGHVNIECSIIVKFGVSIGRVCEAIADHTADLVERRHGKRPHQIKIRVAGVKSKQIARRNLEVVKTYEITG
ncbi:MAG: Asp23/Gls24 family envelope stress response protein [Firmicutes bacterium]|nr:Asp23/Gls24 family envelope stress response protein [Bacillota bacterium]